MTVSYQSDVASSTSGGLIRLLWRWRGSVWKLVYRELILFVLVFLGLSLAYRFLFTERLKRNFEYLVIFCSAFVDMIPLSFILGFYVSFTATRWWNQYTAIPWPDKLMNNIAMYVPGSDENARMLRRTLMRYLNLTLVLVLRSISIAVKRRFPTKEHLVEAGFMTKLELDLHTSVPSNEFNTFWIPCTWFINLLREARQECRITDSSGLKLIMEVVTIATYAFFTASVFGRQRIDRNPRVFNVDIEHRYEPYIPVFTILQFLLYMGLLKLGEQLINPFGDDDEDFELNWIIDRHLKVSFLGVDTLNTSPPPMTKDTYWDELDIKLPYTAAAVSYKKRTYRGSMAAYHVPSEQQGLVVPEFEGEDDYESEGFSDTLSKKDKSSSSIFGSVFGSKMPKRNESLMTLGSDNFDFEASYPEVWRGSYASFLIAGDDDDDHLSVKGSDAGRKNGMKYEITEQSYQGIRGDSGITFMAQDQQQQRKRSDQISVTMQSTESDKSSDPAFLVNSERSPPAFDPTLGVFNSKYRLESYTPSRRPSSSSLVKQAAKEVKGQAGRASTGYTGPDLSSVFQPLEATVSRSSSSASRKTVKSGLLKMNKADPGLKIRPFVKSKVTFSDDTKSDLERKDVQSLFRLDPLTRDRISPLDLTLSSPELSQADLLNSYRDEANSRGAEAAPRRSSAHVAPIRETATIVDTSRAVVSPSMVKIETPVILMDPRGRLRRTSCNDVNPNKAEPGADQSEQGQVWLRHQSLPNIQEIGEESPTSPGPESSDDFGLIRSGSKRNKSDTMGERCIGRLLSRQSEVEEDLLDTGQGSSVAGPGEPKDQHGSNGREGEVGSDAQTSGLYTKYSKPAKKRTLTKTNNNSPTSKQSSTESDSSSYATACSVFSPISEEAVKNNFNNNNTCSNNINKLSFNSTDSSLSSFSSAHQDQELAAEPGSSSNTSINNANTSNNFEINSGSTNDHTLPRIVVLQTSPAASRIDILDSDDVKS